MVHTPTATFDVVILGAGISGIGAAHYLRAEHPTKSFTILESRDAIGGTWDLFRYPGIRSDSDLHTFGYEFKPWRDDEAIADAPRILHYLADVVADDDLGGHIRFHRRAIAADWNSTTQRWSITVRHNDSDDTEIIETRWIFAGTGYYDYAEGFSPDFPGRDRFTGQIVHPQHWPADLDYRDKKVVIIGSGATAVTLVPAMAPDAAHVTMLQRTPSYIIPLPRVDKIANALKKVFGDERGYALARQKNILQQKALFNLFQRFPTQSRALIRKANFAMLPDGFDVDTHFNPPYNPWDQRLCVVPDGDLFRTLRSGAASVETGHIATFTETGIKLTDGRTLDADLIVTATGLNLQLFGGMELLLDGQPVDLATTVAYRGAMLSGIPNFLLAVGYTNASWTLKIGLLSEYFCRILAYQDARGYSSVRPVPDPSMETLPLLNFGAGYVQRSLDVLPKQGTVAPWQTTMSVAADVKQLRNGDVDDRFMHYERATVPVS